MNPCAGDVPSVKIKVEIWHGIAGDEHGELSVNGSQNTWRI